MLYRWERGTSSYQCGTICPRLNVFGVCFVEASGVTEGEDDRAINMRGHLFDDNFREGLGFCRSTNEDVRLDLFYDSHEIIMRLALPFSIFASVRNLSGCQIVL